MNRRRTQAERREQTIGRLLDATVECLATLGYAGTSTSQIVARAGVSQGALFNHFESRIALIVAATDRVSQQHLARFEQAVDVSATMEGDLVRPLVHFVRATCRTRDHAAWHEVMVSARTDDALRDGVREALARFERGLLLAAQQVFNVPDARMPRFGATILSLMHMFDSEAVTVAVLPNPSIEAERMEWAVELLRRALADDSKEPQRA